MLRRLYRLPDIAYGCTAYSYYLLLAYPGADVLLKTLSGFSDIASIYSAGTLVCTVAIVSPPSTRQVIVNCSHSIAAIYSAV